jgi:hypothetical protein
MNSNIKKFFLFFVILLVFLTVINAEDKRNLPLDIYLIIDASETMKTPKNEVLSWINQNIVDKILSDGDRINIWIAGDRPEIIYSGTVSAPEGNKEIKDKLSNFSITAKKADFSGALREAASRAANTPKNRLSYTILITASAEGLRGSFASNGLFRWFRSERYERWQVLIVDPNIGPKVQEAARAYMNSL